jgi:arsenate reductase
VITLCGDANDKCPITPSHVVRLHWGLEDPAKAQGTQEEIRHKFNEVRDTICRLIDDFVIDITKANT